MMAILIGVRRYLIVWVCIALIIGVLPLQCRWLQTRLQCRRCEFKPWVRKMPWIRKWQPAPVFLPGEVHRQRSLVSYSSRGHQELDMAEYAGHIVMKDK